MFCIPGWKKSNSSTIQPRGCNLSFSTLNTIFVKYKYNPRENKQKLNKVKLVSFTAEMLHYQTWENSSRFSKECSGLANISFDIFIEPLVKAETDGCRGVAFFTRNQVDACPTKPKQHKTIRKTYL